MSSRIKVLQDMYEELTMHAATCDMCGSLQPISCETGRTMAYKVLTYNAKVMGSKQAQHILDRLKEAQWIGERIFPPGTQIRRI